MTMHVLFVVPRGTSARHARVARSVRAYARALQHFDHRVTVLDAQPTTTREALRQHIAEVHATQPVDVVEWPDIDGMFLDPIRGIADVVRIYGAESNARIRHALLRIPHWVAVSQHALDGANVCADFEMPDAAVVFAPVDTASIHPRVADSGANNAESILVVADRPVESIAAPFAAALNIVTSAHPAVQVQFATYGGVDDDANETSHVAGLMRSASVVVIPSDDDDVTELLIAAQASGVPVVAATSNANREILKHGAAGLLADGNRAEDIARQIGTLLKSSRLREKMGATGRARAENEFGLARAIEKTLRCYARAIARATAHGLQTANREAWVAERDGIAFASPHSRTGYGVAGSHLLEALQRRAEPIAFYPIGAVNRTLTANPYIDRAIAAQSTIAKHAPSVRWAQQFDLRTHVGSGPRIGYTAFERDAFSEDELAQMQSQDALIVLTEWARGVCIRAGVTVPIYIVPHGVDRSIFHENVNTTDSASETLFMQVGKLEPRKGQFELLCAFEEAFTPADDVRLVFQCHNPFASSAEFASMVAPFRTSPMRDRIDVRTAELPTARDVATLMASAHCGVFPSRAEGWNLEALEMLSMGKTVIATDVTGHTAFLTNDNARLISIDALEPALGGTLPGRWAAWNVAQHAQMVAHLRAVHSERVGGALRQNDAGIATARAYTWDGAADTLVRVLRQIMA